MSICVASRLTGAIRHIPHFFSDFLLICFFVYQFYTLFVHNIIPFLDFLSQTYFHHPNPAFNSSFKSYFHFIVQVQHSFHHHSNHTFIIHSNTFPLLSICVLSRFIGAIRQIPLFFSVVSFVNMYVLVYRFHTFLCHNKIPFLAFISHKPVLITQIQQSLRHSNPKVTSSFRSYIHNSLKDILPVVHLCTTEIDYTISHIPLFFSVYSCY